MMPNNTTNYPEVKLKAPGVIDRRIEVTERAKLLLYAATASLVPVSAEAPTSFGAPTGMSVEGASVKDLSPSVDVALPKEATLEGLRRQIDALY